MVRTSGLLLVLGLMGPGVVACSKDAPPPAAAARAGERVPLGMRKVNFRTDRDRIPVTAERGRFRAIQVQVKGSALEMFDVRITFGNGETWSPPTKQVFEQGTATRRIDLPGEARIIQNIEFSYRSRGPRTGKAVVRVIGIR